jgi:hypothetical protein
VRPQDWFGVAIRTLGCWNILKALGYSITPIAEQYGWLAGNGTNPRYYYAYCVVELLAGLFMLLGADLIVGIAYRAPREDKVATQEQR